MAKIYQVGEQYIDECRLEKEIQKILDVMKKEKRTYSMNIFLLKETISYLENEVKNISNTKIFQ